MVGIFLALCQNRGVKIALTASVLFTPIEEIPLPIVVIDDGRILQVTSREYSEMPAGVRVADYPGAVLAPGFIDLHIHGGAGHDLMHATAEELEAIERSLVLHGVTSYFPTTVTAPLDETFVALERLASAIESVPARPRGGDLRAQPLGIHLEGPFIAPSKRGVHPPEHLQQPSLEIFERLWQAARGQISMMTVAPELPKAEYLIADAARRGVCVCFGHSDATTAEVERALSANPCHVTHTFNAMRPLHHREPGILGAALADDRLTADIIADGIHVHPAVVKAFLRAKGTERAVLITDATSATGMGDGRYRLGGLEVDVHGGRCEYQGQLAGSVLSMDQAVRNVVAFAKWKLQGAVRLATINPARVTGIAGRKGILARDADADLLVLTPRGEVVETIVHGEGI